MFVWGKYSSGGNVSLMEMFVWGKCSSGGNVRLRAMFFWGHGKYGCKMFVMGHEYFGQCLSWDMFILGTELVAAKCASWDTKMFASSVRLGHGNYGIKIFVLGLENVRFDCSSGDTEIMVAKCSSSWFIRINGKE